MEFIELQNKVKVALKKFLSEDKFLLKKNLNERTITHKLAEYLQKEFSHWNVDIEYNRNIDKVKKLHVHGTNETTWGNSDAQTIFPDIIIHNRGNNKNNLLIIEAKKSNNPDQGNFDKEKLIELAKSPFLYKFGLFILFSIEPNSNRKHQLDWYSRGKFLLTEYF